MNKFGIITLLAVFAFGALLDYLGPFRLQLIAYLLLSVILANVLLALLYIRADS